VPKAVFLDRDGTLNREQSFVTSPEQLVVLPGVVDALRRLVAAGWTPVVVTSQSGIARGLYDQTALARIHDALQAACGGLLRGFFHCPHHPDAQGPYGGPCPCRKPAPGMLRRASEVMGLPLEGSALIGDSARDLLMAKGLLPDDGPTGHPRGIRRILVRSGKPWAAQCAALEAEGFPPHHVADDLSGAVDWLLAQESSAGTR